MNMRVQVFSSLDALPPAFEALFDEAVSESFFYSRPWFQNLLETTGRPGQEARIYGVEEDSNGAHALGALVACVGGSGAGWAAPRVLEGCSTMYTTLFAPVLCSGADPGAVLGAAAREIGAERPGWDVVRLDSLDREAPVFDALAVAFRDVGFRVQPFFHFGNWYETIEGESIADLLKRRTSKFRNSLNRHLRRLEKSGEGRFELVTGGPGLDEAIRVYDEVYAASWKDPEPFPRFTEGLIRAAAGAGCLRMATLHIGGRPAAAQVWLVSGGCATIFKQAHDEAYRRMSVGSILTFELLRHVIEVDRVREVDFGHGDDPFKREWLGKRRERWGLMAFNRSRVKGVLGAARHIGGHRAKDRARRLLRRRAGAAALPGRRKARRPGDRKPSS